MAAGAYWPTILGGALVVAFGGLVVTYGWNQRTVSLQRLAFARSVATELVTNLEILEDKTFQPNQAADVHQIVLFPRLLTTALSGAIANGVFASNPDVFSQAVRLAQRLGAFNRRLSYAENAMTSAPSSAATYRTLLRDSLRPEIRDELLRLLQLLKSTYGIQEVTRIRLGP
jgi:hypothetical protein